MTITARCHANSRTGWFAVKMVITLAGLLLACLPGMAQEQNPDLNVPGPEHKRLDGLVGHWNVEVRFPIGPGQTGEGQATCEGKWVMDGRFLRLEYSSMFGGKPLTVVRFVGFDRHQDKYVEVQLESTRTDVLHAQGSASADGKTITTRGTHRDPASGQPVDVRSVTTFTDGDSFTLEMRYGEGDQAKTITLRHQRIRGK